LTIQDTVPARGPGAAAALFAGEGEMRARCRALDWAATPLGPVEQWPAVLRWTVRTAMDSPFPINLWCGPERVLIYNDGYRHVLGAKHPAALGRAGSVVWAEIWDEIAPMFQRIAAGGPPAYADDAPFVVERAPGEGPAAAPGEPNAWFTFALSPVRDDDGAVVAFLNVVSETTGRLLAERKLEAERGRLAEIFERAPAFIATLRGPDHVFETTNPQYQQLIGHRPVIGKPVREALPEVVEQGFLGLLDGVYTTGEPFIGTEVPILLRSAPDAAPAEHLLNFIYQPIRETDDAISGIFVHAVDVTEQVRGRREVERKAEELARLARALEASNRELDQFAYVASHDLKAPLRGIANLSQWIEDDLADRFTDDTREQMRLLRGRVHRMEALIDGILQYSRAGRAQAAPERIDTAALVHEVVDLLAPPAGAEVVAEPGLPVLVTERLPLQQVLMNLVGNGIKYGGGRPRVQVGARHDGTDWEFTVRDDGPGIAPEYHERIFAIFQTLQARDQVESTGIGLSIVKKTVESRGGRVWVESAPGRGAAFRFTWPAQAAEPAP
jgi:signal transduction histidine kinase